MRDVPLVPERDVLQTDDAVRADDSRHPADALGKNRITLVRHGARAFLAGLEFLLRLAHFGSLPVTNLQSELFERSRHDSQRAQILGVIVPLNNLRRHRRGFETKTSADFLFDFRIEMSEGPDCAA